MWMLILFIISALIFGALMFCTKVQTKTRKSNLDNWSNAPWIDGKRPKWPRLTYLLAFIVSLIPVVNIIIAISVIIWFIKQSQAPDYATGIELVYTRIMFKNIVTEWLMEEI